MSNRDNELTYIPCEIAVIQNLETVRLEDNQNLKSPPISNLPQSIESLKDYLLDKSMRSDSFSHTVCLLLLLLNYFCKATRFTLSLQYSLQYGFTGLVATSKLN